MKILIQMVKMNGNRRALAWILVLLLSPAVCLGQTEQHHEQPTDSDVILPLADLQPGKYLSYETIDVIFHLRYNEELEALLRQPELHRVFPGDPSEWNWMRLPAYMAQWAHVKLLLQTNDLVEATNFDDFGPVVYMLLARFLPQGKVVIYDKAAHDFISEIHWESFSEDYTCDCYGEEISGTTHHDRFYAKTARTAFLYFYMWQDKTRDICCMEEFPPPDIPAVE